MFGTNVGAILQKAGKDRREAQAEVWDEVWHLIRNGATKKELLAIADDMAKQLREDA
jgi:hypothetical protein